ncbi:hypothetical protein Tco_0749082, partial [Tanacetum coccineum]
MIATKVSHVKENGILVITRDRATGLVAEGYGDAIYNLEVEQNIESGGENI